MNITGLKQEIRSFGTEYGYPRVSQKELETYLDRAYELGRKEKQESNDEKEQFILYCIEAGFTKKQAEFLVDVCFDLPKKPLTK